MSRSADQLSCPLPPASQTSAPTTLVGVQADFAVGQGTLVDSGTTMGLFPTPAFQAVNATVTSYALSKGLQLVQPPNPEVSRP